MQKNIASLECSVAARNYKNRGFGNLEMRVVYIVQYVTFTNTLCLHLTDSDSLPLFS